MSGDKSLQYGIEQINMDLDYIQVCFDPVLSLILASKELIVFWTHFLFSLMQRGTTSHCLNKAAWQVTHMMVVLGSRTDLI